MNQIKIHTKPIDNHTPVLALDKNNNLALGQYGEFGCGAYRLSSELRAELISAERTDTERVDFLENSDVGTNVVYRGVGWVAQCLGENAFAANTRFSTWRSAVDALIEAEQDV